MKQTIYNELFNKQNGRCAICDAEGTELVFEHIQSIERGGTNDISNLILICRHHNSISSYRPIKEFELVQFLIKLLEGSGQFQNITRGHRPFLERKNRSDIFAEEVIGTRAKKIAIEVKSFSNFTNERIEEIIAQIKSYSLSQDTEQVFMFPGYITYEDKQRFLSAKISVWDLKYLKSRFKKEIEQIDNIKFLHFFGFSAHNDVLPEEHKLIADLRSIEPGRENWSTYQKHCGKILDYLFAEKLSSPIKESSDELKINRRDFILRNYSDDRFWKYLRENYCADFIVIDAKNYTNDVKKNEILQISNYLKKHGTGLFALIITRMGEKRSAYLTRKEKWMIESKMIIILNDDDMEKMILAKASSDDPEEILKQKIEDFRLQI